MNCARMAGTFDRLDNKGGYCHRVTIDYITAAFSATFADWVSVDTLGARGMLLA